MRGIRSEGDLNRSRISFEKSSLPVMWVDSSAKVLDANDSACSSLGYSRKELKDMHVYDFDIRWDKEKILSEALEKLRENRSMTFESVHQRKDGSRYPAEITCTLFICKGKELIFCFIKNITDLKKSREILRKRSEKLKNIVEHANEIFYVHNTNHILTYLSPQCKQIFGYTQEEMKVKWTDLNTENPHNKIGYESTMKAMRTGKRQPPYQLEVRHKSGKKIWIEIDESPLKDKDGKVIGMTGAVRDITKRKKSLNMLMVRHKLSRELNSASGLKDALRICLKYAIDISEMDCGGIYLKDPETGNFCLEVHRGLSDRFIDRIREFPPDTPSARMIYKGEPIYSSYDRMESLTGPKLRSEGLKAIAAIPIRHKKEIIGSLNVSSRSIEKPSSESRIALEIIAADIGDALFRFRAEERLKHSEEKYRALIENIPVGVYTAKLDPDSTYIYISPKVLRILGVSQSYVKRNPDFWVKHVHPEDMPLIRTEVESTKKNHKRFSMEYRMYRHDGKMIWVHDEANQIERKSGDEGVMQGFIEDITDRKESERSIQIEKEKAQNYFNVAGIIMVGLESDQTVSMINKKGCETLELPENEIIGKNWFDNFIPEDFRKKARAAFSCLMKGDTEPFEYGENPIITKSGTRLIEWRNAILRDENGVISGTISSGFDVTEKRMAEEEIKRSHEFLKGVINSASDLIFSVDKKGEINSWNESMEYATGYRAKDIIGKNIFELDIFVDTQIFHSIIKEENIIERKIQTPAMTRSSKVHLLELTLPIIEAIDRTQGYLFIGKDITSSQKLRKAIRLNHSYLLVDTDDGHHEYFESLQNYQGKIYVTRNIEPEARQRLENLGVKVFEMDHEMMAEEGLDKLFKMLRECSGRGKCIIHMDRIDYLIARFGFNRVINLIYDINDHVKKNPATFILHADSNTLDEKNLHLLQAEFLEMPKSEHELDELESELLDILRFISENTVKKIATSFKQVKKRFNISNVTTRKRITELVELGYIEIKKKGRYKYLILTNAGQRLVSDNEKI